MRRPRITCAERALDPRPDTPDYPAVPTRPSGGNRSLAQGLSRVAVSAVACGAFIVLLSFGIRSSFGLARSPSYQGNAKRPVGSMQVFASMPDEDDFLAAPI
jgi:hypothetical protein